MDKVMSQIIGDDLQALHEAAAEVNKVIVGQARVTERLWTCLLAGGHALLEGVPGVGKTVLLGALAASSGGTFSRIQFTSDLMPSDIIGTRIYRASSEEFTVELGPIFANFVLADEVNRAPAKVQSALLEVMAEQQVTLGGQTMKMPSPFLVLATQNPIDSEGTYSLPEAQRDRFMMRIMVEYPTPEEEWEVMSRHSVAPPTVEAKMGPKTIIRLQQAARTFPVDEAVAKYALDIVLATRDPAAYGMPEIASSLAYGSSPRASLALLRAARALTVFRGGQRVTPQEVYDVAYDILNHRLVLSYRAMAEGVTSDDILAKLLSTVKAPAQPTGRPGPGSAGMPPSTGSYVPLNESGPSPVWAPPQQGA